MRAHDGTPVSLKREGRSTDATARMRLEDMTPSGISRSQKDKGCVTPLMQGLRRGGPHRGGARGREKGELSNGAEFPFCKFKSSGGGCWRWVLDSVSVPHATELYA